MRKDVRSKRAYRPKPPFRIIEGLGTELYEQLSPNASWSLARLYGKFNGLNRNNLSLPYKEVTPPLSQRQFSLAIWELVGFGFVDIVRHGTLLHNCSIYALSDRWRSIQNQPQKWPEIKSIVSEIRSLQMESGVAGKRGQLYALRRKLLPGERPQYG